MAIVNYNSSAEYRTQVVSQVLSGTINAGDYFEVSCNDKDIRYTFTGSETFDDAIEAFIALWQDNAVADQPIYEFAEVDVANAGSSTITFTHQNPGVPFTFTYTGSGITLTPTTVTATGPEDVSNVNNYDIGALPSNNDTLTIPIGANLRYNLDALAALTLGYRIFTDGDIGLPVTHQAEGQSGGYPEYRTKELQIKNGASLETLIDCPSRVIKLNGLTVQCTLRVNRTGETASDGTPALNFIGTNANNVIYAAKGSVATAFNSGEAATVATISVSYLDAPDSDVFLVIGFGTTLTTLNMTGGDVHAYVAPTTTNKYGGVFTLHAGTPTTINHYSGTVNYLGGNCTTYKAFPNTFNNFFQNPADKTFTNTTIYPGADWQDPGATITHTATISTPGGKGGPDITGTFGPGRLGGKVITFGA